MSKICERVAPLLVFYACGEAEPGEVTLVEEHLANCAACRAQLSEEQSLQTMFSALPQDADRLDTSGVLLSQCRSELAESLDDMVRPPVLEKTPVFSAFRRWMALRPVWSGAALVMVGLLIGGQASLWMLSHNVVNPLEQAVDVRPGPHISDDQLSKMAVAGINFTPGAAAGTQNVRVQLNAEQPLELTGSVDNSDVRRVLTYVVKGGNRFDPGLRLDCLDILKLRSEDAEVRNALLAAASKDENPAVRLKALEALRDSTSDEAVRQVLLNTLKHDTNPGVRVEAVNLLVNSLEKPESANAEVVVMPGRTTANDTNSMVPAVAGHDASGSSLASVIRELETLQHNDPSQYVRMRSAAALRQLSARGDQ
jgi:anti-sigma factor RsiW